MPFKFIVKIEKNGIAMDVEVNGEDRPRGPGNRDPHDAGYRATGIQWRISPSDGKRILCS